MTSLENFQRLMSGDAPAWVPLSVPMTDPVRDRLRARYATDDLVGALGQDFVGMHVPWPGDAEAWRAAYDRLGVVLPDGARVGGNGNVVVAPPRETLGEASHLVEKFFPLAQVQTVAELESLPWPDVEAGPRVEGLTQCVEQAHERGLVAMGGMECTVFESAWYMRGMDALFVDMIELTDVGQWLLDWYTMRSVQSARAFCDAGVDVIGLGDDVGTQRGMMMSVDFWREHLKPRLQQVISAIREREQKKTWIRYHSDGDIREIIDDLIEMGVDILNPVQPECMPVDEVFEQHGDRLAFWGMIGTQTTMPYGSPEDVKREVARYVSCAGSGRRLVIAPTHVLEPDVPMGNIDALVRADRRLG